MSAFRGAFECVVFDFIPHRRAGKGEGQGLFVSELVAFGLAAEEEGSRDSRDQGARRLDIVVWMLAHKCSQCDVCMNRSRGRQWGLWISSLP